jgi:hypothetical protein
MGLHVIVSAGSNCVRSGWVACSHSACECVPQLSRALEHTAAAQGEACESALAPTAERLAAAERRADAATSQLDALRAELEAKVALHANELDANKQHWATMQQQVDAAKVSLQQQVRAPNSIALQSVLSCIINGGERSAPLVRRK